MATYKKGWTPEEKKIIDTTKSTFKSVFESVKTFLFPNTLTEYSFKEFKESFIYRYARNFIGGLLIIGTIILGLVLFGMFVTWGLPKTDHEPFDDAELMFMRLLLLVYCFGILCLTMEED